MNKKGFSFKDACKFQKKFLIFDETRGHLNKFYRNQIIYIMQKVSNDKIVIIISHDSDYINGFKPILIL